MSRGMAKFLLSVVFFIIIMVLILSFGPGRLFSEAMMETWKQDIALKVDDLFYTFKLCFILLFVIGFPVIATIIICAVAGASSKIADNILPGKEKEKTDCWGDSINKKKKKQ